MTATTTSTALATVQPVFTESERLALAGFLAGYRGVTGEACTLDLRQFTGWCRARSLPLFSVRRADLGRLRRRLVTQPAQPSSLEPHPPPGHGAGTSATPDRACQDIGNAAGVLVQICPLCLPGPPAKPAPGTALQRQVLPGGLDSVPTYRVHTGDMRTSQVADRAGVNTQTLRYYERRGLLPEPPRSPAGYRDYPVSAVDQLRFVKRAQQLGFTLAEVAGLLELADGGPDSCRRARALAEAQAAALDAKIAGLQRMRASLGELLATCQRPRSGRSCPLTQAIPATGSARR